ncbi:MAG TPA: hypothetical protein DDZ90_01455, partial [Planctomycetaceae bacterium]|nr:hypothetical protein [Planctomycetaceae bacterium]
MTKKAASRNQKKEDQAETIEVEPQEEQENPIVCGLVMPISEIDGCSAEHWVEVRDIIEEALAAIDIKTSLVSDGDEVGIIQERIVQNLYDRPIVVCDVSCKNPNVMFELGLRLAFDMPTIILKDDMTNYTFDINIVEHLGYPRDLNYWSIQKFKKLLAKKVKATLQKKDEDDEYSPFLKAFNKKRVADIETKDVTSVEFIMDELKDLSYKLDQLNRVYYPRKILNFGKLGEEEPVSLADKVIEVEIANTIVKTTVGKIYKLMRDTNFNLIRGDDDIYHI